MTDLNLQQLNVEGKKEKDNAIFQVIIGQFIYFWWLFALFILLSMFTAFIYLRYAAPIYKITAKILVKDQKKGGDVSQGNIFSDLDLLNPISTVDNEVEILKSRTLMEKTVRALQLNTSYFSKGSVRQSEIFFSKLPFKLTLINCIQDSISANSTLIYKNINADYFSLGDEKTTKKIKYGDTLNYNFGTLVIESNPGNFQKSNAPIIVKVATLDQTVVRMQNAYSAGATSKTVSTIDLTVTDIIPARGELILNTLLHIYNNMNTEDRNRIADSTIAFVDNRLIYVTKELGNIEKDIQVFKQTNGITDISQQSQLLLQNTSQYMRDQSQQEVQLNVLRSLLTYLKNDRNYSRTIPATLAVQDPTFVAQVENYNTLQLEKQRQLATTTENNPVVEKLTIQIANLRTHILSTLTSAEQGMLINLNQLKKQADALNGQINNVPEKEKSFLEISRQQSIKQELYLYLLKKREETAVSKAANLDNARIVDNAKSLKTPIKPDRSLIYMIAFAAGFIIPALLLYIRQLLHNKIETRNDITSTTDVPIIGEIGRSPFPNNLIIRENPRHPIAEQFRLLRTNLDYLGVDNKGGRSIMVTSSMSGEGKSFISLNLAGMLALGGKKVVLLEFDLRKPKISKYLGFSNNEGISTFLADKKKTINDIAIKVPGLETLYFIASGPIPPNPAELINSEMAKDFFAQLESQFDHIVIDVPPVGVVTDALLLSRFAKISLFIVRQGFTYKKQLELLEELNMQKKLPHLAMVVNDIDRQKGYGYGYGYGYGTSYGYGYFEDEKEAKNAKKKKQK